MTDTLIFRTVGYFLTNLKRSIKIETAITWSKSNLNMMNIYEESTINFWICLCKHCGISVGKISTYSYFAIVWMTRRSNTCDVNYSPSLFTFLQIIKGEALLPIGYSNFSHVTIVFIAKYLFTGSVQILNKIVFKIAKKFISKTNPEISYCLYSEKFK